MHRKVSPRFLVAWILALSVLVTPLTTVSALAAPAGVEAAEGPLWALWHRATGWVNVLSDAVGSYIDPYGGTGSTLQTGSATPVPPTNPALTPEPTSTADSLQVGGDDATAAGGSRGPARTRDASVRIPAP